MNAYQQKWLDVLQHVPVPGWKITASGDDILITLPDDQNLPQISTNLEAVVAQLSLDIDVPKERLKFILRNSKEEQDYILNPTEEDRNTPRQ